VNDTSADPKFGAVDIDVAPRWWMLAGAGGTALQFRYAEYHTVRLVLAGTCNFTLVSPKFAKNLYPFPSIHSASSQSQVR
jgi:hypothetical protein